MEQINFGGLNAQFIDQITDNISTDSNLAQAGKKIGDAMGNAEQNYLYLLSNKDKVGKDGKPITEGDIMAAQIAYQSATRIFEAFKQFLSNSFQIALQAARSLSVR